MLGSRFGLSGSKVVKSSATLAVALGLAGGISSSAEAAGSAADQVQPHRAVYSVSLANADSKAEIIDVDGRMVFEWRDDCDGWGVDQLFLMTFSYASGDQLSVKSAYTTWEAKDGSLYTAKVERERDGVTETHDVSASQGEAVFKGGEGEEVRNKAFELSPETLFPTAHTLKLMDGLDGGPRFISVPVFDGSEIEGANLVSAVIGKARAADSDGEISGVQPDYWPVGLAFFDGGTAGSTPEFEMRLGLQSNGITREIQVAYDDFSVQMALEDVELITDGGC